MRHGGHWTKAAPEAFIHKLAFDFIVQLEKRMEALAISQKELALRLGVSEGAVSQVLNNPQNLTLKTIAKYARALGIKAAVIAYDDQDPENSKGPIGSEVFASCWERAGKPRDNWQLESNRAGSRDRTTIVETENVNRSQLYPREFGAYAAPPKYTRSHVGRLKPGLGLMGCLLALALRYGHRDARCAALYFRTAASTS